MSSQTIICQFILWVLLRLELLLLISDFLNGGQQQIINKVILKQNYKSRIIQMFETILEFNNDSYPFDSSDDSINLKLQTLVTSENYQDFVKQKIKWINLKNLYCPHTINLQQVYQQGFTLHLIYEYVPISLSSHLRNVIRLFQGQNKIEQKRELLQFFSQDISNLTQFLCNWKILTTINYSNFGVHHILNKQSEKNINIKYYIGVEFDFSNHSKQQLKYYYLQEKKKILAQIERDLEMQRKSDYLPNYIIRGNNLIFTDNISDTKTKKKARQSDWEFQRQGQKKDKFKKQRPSRRSSMKPPKQPKQHKYSCNFQNEGINFEFDQSKLNKSFQSQNNQQYSVTQSKYVKIQVQQQKATHKSRKNSVKFKITTFQQISIDNGSDNDFDFDTENIVNPPDPQAMPSKQKQKKPQNNAKNYSQKVNEAKAKAEILLNKYIKSKNKSMRV